MAAYDQYYDDYFTGGSYNGGGSPLTAGGSVNQNEPAPPPQSAGPGYLPWTDPDNPPPNLGDPNQQPAGNPGQGNYWAWNGSAWEIRQMPRANNTTPPPATTNPPVIGGGDYHLPGEGGGSYGGLPPFMGGGQYPFPRLDLPTFVDDLGDFTPEDWNAPDPSEIENDPSYQFRFNEGWRPIQNSRAAQGLSRTGATLKAMQRYGQGFASNEYDRIYDRAADSYDRRNSTKLAAHNVNRQSRLDRYDRNVGELTAEFAPQQRWAELQYQRDWDLYKYQNDDAFRRWETEGDWTNNPPD